jgi:GTPase SAR1 family protein
MAGFVVFFAELSYAIYNRIHACSFGIYGAEKVGKTTLHRQLRTRGEVPEISIRTDGLQRATRKIVKIDGDLRTIKSADVGGQAQYWTEWKKDMMGRKVQYIIFMIDSRHLDEKFNLDNQLAWQFMVDIILDPYWKIGKKHIKKKQHDYPKAIGLWANKYDLWGDVYEHDNDIRQHPIFEPFRLGIQQLNEIGIPTHQYITSAQSDSEMVYRGVMTMIKDY